MNYTKGEWKIVHNDNRDYPFIVNDEIPCKVIAQVIGDGVKIEGNHANAHLIAAAPEMYEALKEAKRWIEYRSHRTDELAVRFIDKLDELISKVEGK